MTEIGKLLYIVVVEDVEKKGKEEKQSFRYTRPVLQSTLQLMGCKARHAFKISRRVFEVLKREWHGDGLASTTQDDVLSLDTFRKSSERQVDCDTSKADTGSHFNLSKDYRNKSLLFELYKRRTTMEIKRSAFFDVVCDALTEYKYVGPNQRQDLALACRIRERKESVTVLLCGTSGCGKSTLSALLGSRLGVTTVISTDSIRHMMRSFVEEEENPLLWASTYHAGEHLDPLAVAEAVSKKKSKHSSASAEPLTQKQMAVQGFKAQSEMVIDSLDRLITSWENRNESVVVEGVHLSLNFVMGLMKKHRSILPFMIYITKEDKHMERFAVRAKYMTLDPARNKYVKYIQNIRAIQEYLCKRADKHLVPKINNTNVDKSVAAIHATVFSCLRRRAGGEQLYDPATNTAPLIAEEYRSQCAANSLGSKGMFQLIQNRGSTSHLMALINHDGSVARTWPIHYSPPPLLSGPPDQVNVHFGLLGVSSWPGPACGTSHAGSSFDDSSLGRHYSSCCSSPRFSEGTAKEPKEEQSVDGSEEEETEYGKVGESDDEEWSDRGDEPGHMEEVGSVDEESTKTDEEYDDLAMADAEEEQKQEQEGGYWSGEGDEGEERGELWLGSGRARMKGPIRLGFSLSFGVDRRPVPPYAPRRSSSIPPPPRPVYVE